MYEPGSYSDIYIYRIIEKRYACVCAAIAEALHSKVCVQATKKRILDCLEDPQLKKMVSVRWSDGCVHVLPMGQLNAKVKTVRKWRIRRTEKSRNALILETYNS